MGKAADLAAEVVQDSQPPSDAERQLREDNRKLSAKVRKLEHRQAELYDATMEAVRGAIALIDYQPVKTPPKDRRTRGGEVACVALGDLQLGKVTPTYNADVCAERIDKLAQRVVDLTEIQRADHPVKECHVWAIGDFAEGELIFPGQEHELDLSLFEQVLVNGPQIFGDFLRTMLANFETVKVSWCLGNHGRIGGRASKQMKPRNNSDRMIYAATKAAIRNDRLEWLQDPFTYENWYSIDTIGDIRFLLFHGDQIRGQLGLPFYGYGKKIQGWAAGAIEEPFDIAVCGHYHTYSVLTFNKRQVYLNGSPESYNTYAQENMGAMSRPCQIVNFVHPKRGVTAHYPVWLD